MKYFFLFIIFCGISLADEAIFNVISGNDLLNLRKEIQQFDKADFSLQKSLAKFKNEEAKIALSFLAMQELNANQIGFSQLSRLYFLTSKTSKRDQILKQIRQLVAGYKIYNISSQIEEVESIVWFFLIIENDNLLQFLSKNKLSVRNLIDIVKEKKDFEFLKNLLYSKEEEVEELLWNGRASQALDLTLRLPESEMKKIFLARIFFQTKNVRYKSFAQNLIENRRFENDGFVYDYLRYLQKTSHYKDALSLIHESKINPQNVNFGKFWSTIEELFRVYIDERDFVKAYDLISSFKFNDELMQPFFARAEFLSGFLAMRFLKNPEKALEHFERLYNSKHSSVAVKARGAYFTARTYREMGKGNLEKKWLLEASKFLNAFYGILALDRLNQIPPVLLLGKLSFTDIKIDEILTRRSSVHKFYFDDLFSKYYADNQIFEGSAFANVKNNLNFKVGTLLLLLEKFQDANIFFASSVEEMDLKETRLAFQVLNEYLAQSNIPQTNSILTTFTNRAGRQGTIIVESYPILDFIIDKDDINPNSLIHGIIRQESNFVLRAISGPGATGLMQVMPATGRIISRSAKLDFNMHRLKNDFRYNIQIGSYYMDELLRRFGRSYVFSLIGYNAGPNRVSSWKQRFFEPQTEDEMIDFIELIPFKETREYVQKVLENEAIYNYLITYHLENSNLPLRKKDQTFTEFFKNNRTPPPALRRVQKKKPIAKRKVIDKRK